MTQPVIFSIAETDHNAVTSHIGTVAVFADSEGKLDLDARKVNGACKRALVRFTESEAFAALPDGAVSPLAYPAGISAVAVLLVKLSKRANAATIRRAGANLAKAHGAPDLVILAARVKILEEFALGFALRNYQFTAHKTDGGAGSGAVSLMVTDVAENADLNDKVRAVADGVFFTRDLTNEPANTLTTTEFASRLKDMKSFGLTVEILDEAALEKLGMGALLSVGLGSDSPSKVVVMQWNGGGDEAPFAFVGKGVVFDTGGISLKSPAGMEEMTMDMGGAGVVAGVMRTLALRKAKANVVGLVGLVENMPSGNATRPGDVVTSMKGDTIEVINTDAEGRMVLADVLWYTQERFNPSGIVNLATLTGAMVVALGHDNGGAFSNDDTLVKRLSKSAEKEGEGLWRMPLGDGYAKGLKSRIADMKNVGGRPGGASIAAEFLKKFIQDDMPWCHLDIAGVALTKTQTTMAPAGATGWGVMTLNRLIADHYED